MADDKQPAPEPAVQPALAPEDGTPLATTSLSADLAVTQGLAQPKDLTPLNPDPAPQQLQEEATPGSHSPGQSELGLPPAQDGDPELPTTQVTSNTPSGGPSLEAPQEEGPASTAAKPPTLEAEEEAAPTPQHADKPTPQLQPQQADGSDEYAPNAADASGVPQKELGEELKAGAASDSGAAERLDAGSPGPKLLPAAPTEEEAAPGAPAAPPPEVVEQGAGEGRGDEAPAQTREGSGSVAEMEQPPRAASPQQDPGQDPEPYGTTAVAAPYAAEPAGGPVSHTAGGDLNVGSLSRDEGTEDRDGPLPYAASTVEVPRTEDAILPAEAETEEAPMVGSGLGSEQGVQLSLGKGEGEAAVGEVGGAAVERDEGSVAGRVAAGEEQQEGLVGDGGDLEAPGAAGGERAVDGGGGTTEGVEGPSGGSTAPGSACKGPAQGGVEEGGLAEEAEAAAVEAGEGAEVAAAGGQGQEDEERGKVAPDGGDGGGDTASVGQQAPTEQVGTTSQKEGKGATPTDGPAASRHGGEGDAGGEKEGSSGGDGSTPYGNGAAGGSSSGDDDVTSTPLSASGPDGDAAAAVVGEVGAAEVEAANQRSRPSSSNRPGTAGSTGVAAAATNVTAPPTAAVRGGDVADDSGVGAEDVESSGGNGGGDGDYTTAGEEEEEAEEEEGGQVVDKYDAVDVTRGTAVAERTESPQVALSGGLEVVPPVASDEEEEEDDDEYEDDEEEEEEEGVGAKGAEQQVPQQPQQTAPLPPPPSPPAQQPQVAQPAKGPIGADADEDYDEDDDGIQEIEEGDDEDWEDQDEEEEADDEAPTSNSTHPKAAAAAAASSGSPASPSPQPHLPPPLGQQHPSQHAAASSGPSHTDSGSSAASPSHLLPPITSPQAAAKQQKLPQHKQSQQVALPRQQQPQKPSKQQKQKQSMKATPEVKGRTKGGSREGGGAGAAVQGLRNAMEGDDPDPDSITQQYLKLLRAGALQRPSTAPASKDPPGPSASEMTNHTASTGGSGGGGAGGGPSSGGASAPSSRPPTSRPSSRQRSRSHTTLPDTDTQNGGASHTTTTAGPRPRPRPRGEGPSGPLSTASGPTAGSRSHSGSTQRSAAGMELARLQARTAWEVAPLSRRTSTPHGSDGPPAGTGDGAAPPHHAGPPGGSRLLPPLSIPTPNQGATGSGANSPIGSSGESPLGASVPYTGAGASGGVAGGGAPGSEGRTPGSRGGGGGGRSSHLKALRPDPPVKAFSPHSNVSAAPYAKMYTPGPGAYSPAVIRRGDSSDVGGSSFGGGSPPRAWAFGSARQRPGHVCIPYPSQSPGPVYLPSKDAVSTLNNVITHKFERNLPGGRYSLTAGVPSNAPLYHPGPGAYEPGTTPAGDPLAPGGSGAMPAFSFAHTPKLLTPALNGAALPVLSKEHVREYYGSLSPGPTAYSPDTSPVRTRAPSYSVAGRRACWFDPPELSPGPIYKPKELDRTGRLAMGEKPHAVVGNGPKFYDPNSGLSASAWLSLNHARRANYGAYSPGPIYLPNDQPQGHVRTPALGAGHVDRFFSKVDQPGRIQ